jgi:formate dehydrogenase subunit delta
MSGLAGDEAEPEIHKSTEQRLVYMANQIADFFISQGDEGHATAGVADHIKSFWGSSMLRHIYGHIDATGGDGLKPIALKAIRRIREAAPGQIRRDLESAGHPNARAPGDDAG